MIKWGRRGYFLACPGYPECKNTKQFTKNEDGTIQIVEKVVETTDEICDKCGSPMVVKVGRFGGFLACSQYPECKTTKPLKLGVKCPVENCEGRFSPKTNQKGANVLFLQSVSQMQLCPVGSTRQSSVSQSVNSPFLVEKVKKQSGVSVYCQNEGCGYQEAG